MNCKLPNDLLWASSVVVLAVILPITMAQSCFSPQTLNFTSENGKLWVNSQRFYLKGASWFGFETSSNVVHGLWSGSYTFFLDFLANNGFNAIRLPFHLDLVINDRSPANINCGVNSDLQGFNSLQVMDKIVQAAAQRGMEWTKLLQRYKSQWNVIAADLKNEPYSTTWGTGNSATDWNLGAVRLANAIASQVSDRFLFFVEGTSNSPACRESCFYGENLTGAKSNPVVINNMYKLVYSPHVYGPNVYGQSYFSASNFPTNMPAIWDDHWGFIPTSTGRACVIGEWGGPYSGNDKVWMDALVEYLKSKDQTDQFFWCLNPDSGDTGGLLKDDWSSPDSNKLALLAHLVSSPTKFSGNSQGQVCVNGASQPTPSASVSSIPQPSASSSSLPQPSPSSSPALLQPSASSTPKVFPTSSPADQPQASSTPEQVPSPSALPIPGAADQFDFYAGTSAWWMAVTIPGSVTASVDCGNGQGLVEMAPAWMPYMWTFVSTNGNPCQSTLTFVVNGVVQTVVAPWA